MTTKKNKHQELDIKKLVDEFDQSIDSFLDEYPDKEKRLEAIIEILNVPYNKGVDFEDQKEDIKAVEQYFLCLGLLKKVLESDLFDSEADRNWLQQLLIKFDLPSSLRMCRIMFEGGNYDEVYHISERILAIDPQNEDARGYINFIKKAEKDKDWKRLKDAKDVQGYIQEYYHIQQEREQRQQKKNESVAKKKLNQKKESDPAKFILHALESIIKFLMMVPYLLYSKLGEPLFHMLYDMYLLPGYKSLLVKVPMSAPVFKFVLYSGTKFLSFITNMVESISGKNPDEQNNRQEEKEQKQDVKPRRQDEQYGRVE